jgi:YegS/Rv2252/BmrU family lipid kinase
MLRDLKIIILRRLFMKKCLLIINPKSGKMKIQNEIINVIEILNRNKYNVEVKLTLEHEHAKEMINEIDNIDLIICAGGDGTLNQVISGLITNNIDIPLGYIPCGSTNDFANTQNLSFDIKKATQDIIDGKNYKIDIGKMNKNDYFTYIASFGAFTSVSYNTPQNIKNAFGHFAYVVGGFADLIKIKPHHIIAKYDNEIIDDNFILGMVLNATSVGGVLKLRDEQILLDDGMFEVLLLKQPKDLIDVNIIFESLINGKFENNDLIKYFKTSKIDFEMDEELSWSLDGEEKMPGKKIQITNLNKIIKLRK